MGRSFVVGVGMTKFDKPRGQRDYPEIGLEAAVKALTDAGITYDDVEQAYTAYVYGDSTCGQRVLYQLGLTQIPIVNVNNNCSTGSSALALARAAVESGQADCVMALGFEKMAPGSLSAAFNDRVNPLDRIVTMHMEGRGGSSFGPFAAQIFGEGAAEYCDKYGATVSHINRIAAKNHRHSVNNPYAQFRVDMTEQQVASAPQVTPNLTRAGCCPTSDGGACVIVASEKFVRERKLENQAIEILGMGIATDSPRVFERSHIELAGADMTRTAAQRAYKAAKLTPKDIKVVELHDCFAANELITYDALGLCPPGQAGKLIDANDVTYGGKYVVNPSGGLLSKGHPLGATGLGMTFFLVMQLRGWAGKMQADQVNYALLHNLGLGGSAVVAIFGRPDFYKEGGEDGRKRMGYNHGAECKEGVDESLLAKTKSKKNNEWARAKL
ncbi:hypothetical protein PROFUN_10153 [Planoprotostelium fungivorum]|uniref:propanoyl-CoA C-acyltransferase n=1 Tax=Planoprotostelium fungivorum TaxID=1890364 RepID=A0A2P6NEJ1_9EUKA|nr:hypothetical protein PROFUN_10153 [Planoprotostelium fungivorum]